MNFLLALSVLCGFAAKLTTVSGLNSTAPTTMNASLNVMTSSGCRGQLKVYNNLVESPGYPFRYPNYMDCHFWVPINQGKALRIVFDDFNLESHSSCGYDYVRIKNDMGVTYGKYCGLRSGKTVLVTGSRASFHFHSDSSVQRKGFRLYLSIVSLAIVAPSTQPPAPTTYPACPQLQVVNNTMESPGYPRYYSHRIDHCNISVPTPLGANMRVFFQAFNIRRYRWSCWYYGSLEIMNENGTSFGRYCGYRNGQAVVVNGRLVVLRFRSGNYGSYGRFRLLFIPVYPTVAPSTQPPAPTTHPVCPQVVNNTVESPGYPSYYSHRMDCNISVPIPLGSNMRVVLQVFNIYRYSWSCWSYGSLEIMNENGTSFGRYCGYRNGQAVVVNGRLVVLRFRSGYYGSYGRFRLLFTPVYPIVAPSTQPPAPTTYPACPQVVNNTMESPGYPRYYSHRMDCNISVPIPLGANMRVFFQAFNIRRYRWSCWYYGSLELMNENGASFGQFCGYQYGRAVVVNGPLVVVRFRSGYYGSYGRFRLLFTPAYPTVAPSTQPPPPTTYPACPQVVNNTMESPGYPGYYSHRIDHCNISIPTPLGANMRVFFQAFNIRRYQICWYLGSLEIMNENGTSFGRYCGYQNGQAVVVYGRLVVLRFRSGYYGTYGRFRLLFTPVYPTVAPSTQPPAPTTYPACPQVVNNTMESPGYPSSYSHRMDCNISVSIPLGANMRIFFQVFYIRDYGWNCGYYGSLEIMNENGASFGRYCGYRNGQAVVVNGRLVVLTFRSGYYGSYGYFRLLFTRVYPTVAPSTQPPAPTTYPACPQVVNNTMESPGYPSSYSHRMDCNISVSIPLGANMRVFFQDFYIPDYGWNCRYYGSLEILNENGTSFGRYCDYRNGQAVVVYGRLVVLRFRSGSYATYGYFRLLFTRVYPTVAPSTQPPAPTTYPACPQVVNNTMESPGYPRYYSQRMDCSISVPIPLGANIRIFFQVFNILDYGWNCRYYGSLEIMNENGDSFGKYCDNRDGRAVVVNGSHVVLRFRSGYSGSYGRFRLLFTPVYPFPTSQPSSSQVPPSNGSDAQSQLRRFIAVLRDILVLMEYVVGNQLGGPSSGKFTKRDHIGQFKERAQLDVAKGKRQVEDQKLAKEREESIQKNELNEEKKEA
ncbi:cubilin-like isoform X2 [Acropora palmata]|uniref:cubilin-like isoform X2 n=1 Tax=Acropora palmata TaxID=6131 RepID=UPI003D9FF494